MTRRGLSMLELIVATVLLAAVMSFSLQMLRVTGDQRRATDRRQTAIVEIANVMECLSAIPWDDLTAEAARRIQLSDEASRALPGGQLEIELTQADDDPRAKRIALQIRWQDRTGRFVLPVQLVAWRYR